MRRAMCLKFRVLPIHEAASISIVQLSQRRADAVIRYLVENHNIPLRRIVTPYGYGEMNPVAENETREGRAQNRRVEIKLLVNKGLTAPTPTMNPGTSGSGN